MKICARVATRILFGLTVGGFAHAEYGLAADTINSAELSSTLQASTLDKIDRRLQTLPDQPPYLYETDSATGKITSTWVEMTGGILGTKEVRNKYDEFYQSAVGYQSLAKTQLIKAKHVAKQGDLEMANHYLAESERSLKQFSLSSQGAFEAYQVSNSVQNFPD